MAGEAFARAGRQRFKRKKLEPEESWEETFTIRVKDSARPRKYALVLTCTGEKVERDDMSLEIEITE